MTPSRDDLLTRAALGELTEEERRRHAEQLAGDQANRAEFAALAAAYQELRALPAPTLAPGFDGRVMARLRSAQTTSLAADTMRRQFWRLATPALAAAAVLLVLAVRSGGTVVQEPAPDLLAVWYPLSADPTVTP